MKLKNLSEKILRSVKSKGFKYIELPSVIETNHIVQRSGESFRKFIFSFTDQKGNELCLRPDLTIASCLRYLENNLKGKEKIFYTGQAYRKSQNKKDSIIRNQVGFEIIGSQDEKNDDKEIINTSLKSLKNFKYSSGTITIGNVEIFNLLISKLDIPKRWKLRLSRHFWREDYFNDLLQRLETNSDVDPTIVEVDKRRYLKMLKDDQSSIVAGRTIKEVLERLSRMWSESLGRIVVTVSAEHELSFVEMMTGADIHLIGMVSASSELLIEDGYDTIIHADVDELIQAWKGALDMTGGIE